MSYLREHISQRAYRVSVEKPRMEVSHSVVIYAVISATSRSL